MRYEAIWPIFGVRVRTPRLTLRPVSPEILTDVADLAAEGIHDPGEMPFNVPWSAAPPDVIRRESLQHYFGVWAANAPGSWRWPMAVYEGTTPVGVQTIMADDFAVTRQFTTGSWVGRRYQGDGIGREMRAAVLHLGFASLGAVRALTSAFVDNPRSIAVTRHLGYEDAGSLWRVRQGRSVEQVRFVLPRERWERTRRSDISVAGLDEEVRAHLGVPRPG
jgi:RimJ/RimL family protein N-acetyltransferase